MMAEQIHKSTRSSDVRSSTVAQGSKYFRERATVKNVIRKAEDTNEAIVDGSAPSVATLSTGEELIAEAVKEVRATSEANVSAVTDPSTRETRSYETDSRPQDGISIEPPRPMADVSANPALASLPPESEQTVNA